MRKRALAAAILAGMATHASAFQIDTNDDWAVRWDNTMKYNLMMRVKSQDSDVENSPGGPFTADSNYSFDKGEIVSNRVDLLSELDVVWKDTLGFRISGAGWYDQAYENNMNQADDIALNEWSMAISGAPGELSDYGEKLHHAGGELLDAFVFWNWELGETQGNLRAGRHVIYWGQSLLGVGAGSSAGNAMNPIDLSKALSVPGSEVKELFMPTNKISTVVQFTENLSFSAYYGLEWKNNRFPVGASYFAPATGFTEDIETFFLQPGAALLISDDEHPEEGEWGVNLTYYFEGLDLEVSAFYLNYHDKQQNGLTASLTPTGAAAVGGLAGLPASVTGPIAAAIGVLNAAAGVDDSLGSYFGAGGATFQPLSDGNSGALVLGHGKWIYKENIDLYGLSFSKQIGDVSYGMDVVYREGAPLRPDLLPSVARSFVEYTESGTTYTYADMLAADEDNYTHNVGDTWSVVVNAIGLLNDNGWWEGGSYIVEATFQMLDEVDYGSGEPAEYLGLMAQDSDGNGSTNVEEGRITSHLAFVFRPTWYQVFPGVDMTVPVSASVGIDGNGLATSQGGDEESGNASIGVDFLVNQAWSVSMKYNNYFGSVRNTFGNFLKDRDNVSLTFKRTF